MTAADPELTAATPIESAQSRTWDRGSPTVSVVVSTHGRAALLDGLLHALEAQHGADAEVIVADNGSPDETWTLLTTRCATTSLRLIALRLPFHDGPAVPRNTCIARSRAAIVAFTDDDCLPTAGWLAALTSAFDDATDLVQGRTIPEPGGWSGPWGRSLEVNGPTGLYETANLAARRTAILAVGGFGSTRLLTGRAFGEDVVLGAAISRRGGFRFAPDALVHHRVMAGTYRDFICERQRLTGFPLLLRQAPELRQRAFARVFLSRRTALTDLALAGVVAAAVLGNAWSVLPAAVALPWLGRVWGEATARPGRPRVVRVAQLVAADVVGLGALVAGSLRARRLLL